MIGCKGWWAAKWWMMNLTAVMILILWRGITSYMGWPTEAAPPETFKLVGFYSQEPKALFILADVEGSNQEKNVFDHFLYNSGDPIRLYKMPYDKEMHKDLEAAMERILKGGYVIASRKKIFGAEDIKNFQDSQQNGGGEKSNGGSSLAERINFYILPPSFFMKKPNY